MEKKVQESPRAEKFGWRRIAQRYRQALRHVKKYSLQMVGLLQRVGSSHPGPSPGCLGRHRAAWTEEKASTAPFGRSSCRLAQMVSPMGNNNFERPPEDTLRYVSFVSKCLPSAGLWLKSWAAHPCDRDLVSGPARLPRVLCPLCSFERAKGLGMCQG